MLLPFKLPEEALLFQHYMEDLAAGVCNSLFEVSCTCLKPSTDDFRVDYLCFLHLTA